MADAACGLPISADIEPALSRPAVAAEAASAWPSNACSAREEALNCAALAERFEKAEALRPTADIACALSTRALLARPAKAAELAPIAENTRGSALSAFIATPSLAICLKALALLAKRALLAALEANFEKAALSLAKLAKCDALAKIAAIAAG